MPKRSRNPGACTSCMPGHPRRHLKNCGKSGNIRQKPPETSNNCQQKSNCNRKTPKFPNSVTPTKAVVEWPDITGWTHVVVVIMVGTSSRWDSSYVWVQYCDTDDLVTHPYDINIYLLSHTDGLLSHPFLLATLYRGIFVMSCGRFINSSVWHGYTFVMSYGWLIKSPVWDNNSMHMSYEWVTKSSVWHNNSTSMSYVRVISHPHGIAVYCCWAIRIT